MEFLLETPYRQVLIGVAVFVLISAGRFIWNHLFADPVVAFDLDDPEMIAAVAKARSGLSEFWAHAIAPARDESDFAVKVRFALDDGKSTEQPWLELVTGGGPGFKARIINKTQHMKKGLGDLVDCDEKDIVDWAYRRDGKLVGGETMRLMMRRVSPREARKMAEYIQFADGPA